MSEAPFFSVVSAVRNAEDTLPALLASLLEQTEQSWEWVVQDAASSDRSASIAASAGDARVTVRSEPDDGIYDGLNRAVARASGRYVLVLGADDELAGPQVLRAVRELVERAPVPPDVVLGSARLGERTVFSSSLGLKTLVVNTVHHQGAFYARSQFEGFEFDQRAPVVADYEHSLRLLLDRARVLSTSLIIARCGDAGVSQTTSEIDLYRQMHMLRSKHLPASASRLLYAIGLVNVRRRAGGPSRSRSRLPTR